MSTGGLSRLSNVSNKRCVDTCCALQVHFGSTNRLEASHLSMARLSSPGMTRRALSLATPFMIAEVVDHVGRITFNNPERRNAIKLEMNEALVDICAAFDADPDVRVVVMQGAGDAAFISGADISEFAEHRSTPEGLARFDAISAQAGSALANLSKPLVAKIRGFCMGGGLATALTADLRITAEDGQFAIPAAKLGIGYNFSGVQRLVGLVGPSNASEILMTGSRFGADRALQMGLVNRITGVNELDAEVNQLVEVMAANAPLSIKASKVAIAEAMHDRSDRDVGRAEKLIDQCFASADYTEGRTAFMEKRAPRFRGV